MTIQSIFAKPGFTGIFWGVLGGVSLIALPFFTTNGYLQIVPYFFILAAAVLTTKYVEKSKVRFLSMFKSGFFAFLVSTLLLYVYVAAFVNPHSGISFVGHLWRWALVIGMGIIGSGFFSFFAKPVR